MSDRKLSNLYLLYYTASEQSGDDSFVFQHLSKEEGIPIGKLFFWIKGIWEENVGEVSSLSKELYYELMGLHSLEQDDDLAVGPFQNIEEIRRFAYILCQQLNCSTVKLFSVDDFNECYRLSTSKSDLLSKLNECADDLENLDVQKSKSFFNKILSRN